MRDVSTRPTRLEKAPSESAPEKAVGAPSATALRQWPDRKALSGAEANHSSPPTASEKDAFPRNESARTGLGGPLIAAADLSATIPTTSFYRAATVHVYHTVEY